MQVPAAEDIEKTKDVTKHVTKRETERETQHETKHETKDGQFRLRQTIYVNDEQLHYWWQNRIKRAKSINKRLRRSKKGNEYFDSFKTSKTTKHHNRII